MAADLGCTLQELMQDSGRRQRIEMRRYVTESVGLPTLTDILAELAKPGCDPRESFEAFAFAGHVATLEDLKPGMQLPGIVTNVTRFCAFVDVGVHQDGLVHVSELADRFVKDPAEVVKVQQKVMVTVLEVDKPRKRISLSMRSGTKIDRAAQTGPKTQLASKSPKTGETQGHQAARSSPSAYSQSAGRGTEPAEKEVIAAHP